MFISFARRALLMPWRFISLLSCQATTRVTASALANSRMPASSRNSSRVDPQCDSSSACSFHHFLHSLLRQGDLGRWRFLGLLDEPMRYPNSPFRHEKDQACDPVVCELAAYLPQPCSERSAQRHSNRPSDLQGREVSPDRPAIFGRISVSRSPAIPSSYCIIFNTPSAMAAAERFR